MKAPPAFILDRLSILHLKVSRIGSEYLPEKEAYEDAVREFKSEGIEIESGWLPTLIAINGAIWTLESDIRRGREGDLTFGELGRRAIMIRDLNKARMDICNSITKSTGIGFVDGKSDHASQ